MCLSYVCTRGDFDGFLMNPKHFSNGFILPFTGKCVSEIKKPRFGDVSGGFKSAI